MRDFLHPSSPTLGPTQHPVRRIRGSFPGVKRSWRVVDHPIHLTQRLKIEWSYVLTWAFVACYRVEFTFNFQEDKARQSKENNNSTELKVEHIAEGIQSYQKTGYSKLKGWNTHEYPG
jgi:hypothetical protein